MIFYECPKCQQPMASPESMAGQSENCPNCGNVTVVAAASAAKAGAPAMPPPAGSGYDPRHAGVVVSTERTSKTLKMQELLAILGICGGVALIVGGWPREGETMSWAFPVGLVVSLGGFAWWVITKIRIWWRHA